VLWRSVEASTGDFIVWLDADLGSFTPDYVTGLLEPLLLHDDVAMVRSTYRRTFHGEGDEGGRVTELTARPVLKLLYPELAHIRQPLGGEYAIRRDVALATAFEIDYGVEMGLLIDVSRTYGVESIVQVDLGARTHRNRPLSELHEQALQVMRAALSRIPALNIAADDYSRPSLNDVAGGLAQAITASMT
jgi:glucosyl-3-phosphoglycerate synthase